MDVVIRHADEDEWEVPRDVRVAALSSDPDAFLSTAEAERLNGQDLWRVRARSRAIAWRGGRAVGLIGWARHDGYLEIVGLWVQPDQRGGDVAAQLTSFVLDQVRTESDDVRLAVISTNDRARRFYERVGFEVTHREPHSDVGELVWMALPL